MKTEIVLENENLWQRIQGFSLDQENATFPFSKKLAKEENWSAEFTRKAIEEYKKFVYLCCILPHGASPSETVDKVWHMHLIYTQNYWEDFCPNILKRSLHHHPSTGGNSENTKHQNWFSETLENYRKVFGLEPPAEIWNGQISKLKPKISWLKNLKLTSFFTALLLLGSCSDSVSGVLVTVIGGFIAFFVVLNIFAAILGTAFGKNKDKNGSNGEGGSISSDGGSSCSSGGDSGGSSCGGGGCGGCGGGGCGS
ncbi:hypothetical protein [Chryseobacterium sp. Leaf394]|uniref:glycine-rich domain-containing protein n=1 Tax=Chryseobacterium sp. Leaf394 TaxID=1736361 RepID=UPI0006F36C3E|nr:hypothetical protein [Chryseobacterium sp. Leaf394]KQS90269.1 hypothetical protein ASG21_14210 [Chryseobacterium sp. Leaf394]